MVAREVSEAFEYYAFAKAFGWTPAQVEEIDDATLRELHWIIDEMAKEDERQMKKASHK